VLLRPAWSAGRRIGGRRLNHPLAFTRLSSVQIADRFDDALPDVESFEFAERQQCICALGGDQTRVRAIFPHESVRVRQIVWDRASLARVAFTRLGYSSTADLEF
jgi:hypothetical protein